MPLLSARELSVNLGLSKRMVNLAIRRAGISAETIAGRVPLYDGSKVEADLAARGWVGNQKARRAAERENGLHACSKCGAMFARALLPPSSIQNGRYWCRACLEPAKRACDIKRRRMKGGTKTEPIDLRVLAERDGWRCAICRGLVTRETWSQDHVIPLSKGGPHTYENVVLAHRDCNSKRGAGAFPIQAPLFARLGVAI